ncbi:hypothetical protein LEP1GSC133_2119 [Leptospira borgpetersenii serovar Pomona str. 200901868]|uniref:Uncharacterized protein n=1 Tax=Leptospira borgpetersenii serovar Pomona str. 200901868 TaxID=1192866 RepID=M6VY99_LEPBO|nr:hypothetical protein LEP1GSC066_3446 [Leptospira sp. serovar Kenya str. Sh9]EMO08440.1 hypothetical protein LEP1GSC137_3232 [Leptospira borgpetersenii str. Noumea 25]EMO61830.1 hypothetical protein LEP1GSC133_2119 [Leptospira borgpetersenii serovar Pomona str. 200901868]ENO63524.1 hypothetical protein LEP1GSC191_2019 [Leptospira borgpetersenii serovar Mini str. 201000851]
MKFVNLFLKCENYNKSRFDEQILKVRPPTYRKFFLIF